MFPTKYVYAPVHTDTRTDRHTHKQKIFIRLDLEIGRRFVTRSDYVGFHVSLFRVAFGLQEIFTLQSSAFFHDYSVVFFEAYVRLNLSTIQLRSNTVAMLVNLQLNGNE